MNIENIPVRRMDILKEMELYNKRIRDNVSKNFNSDEIKSYDLGVKNAMNVLEMLVSAKGKETGRLIYQKYGEETHEVEEYARLSEVLEEMYHGQNKNH